MNKYFKIAVVTATAMLFMCGCSEEQELPAETTLVTTTTAPEPDHSLVRNFTINEVFSDMNACGKKFVFPLELAKINEDGAYEDWDVEENRLIFPDGSYVKIYTDGVNITGIDAEAGVAPHDFSALGMTFGMTVSDISYGYGIPDAVYGKPDEEKGSYVFTGAGTQTLELAFEGGKINILRFRQ